MFQCSRVGMDDLGVKCAKKPQGCALGIDDQSQCRGLYQYELSIAWVIQQRVMFGANPS